MEQGEQGREVGSEVRAGSQSREGLIGHGNFGFFPEHDEKTPNEFKQRCVIGSGLLLWQYLSGCCMKTR